jgi:hypothetical protein
MRLPRGIRDKSGNTLRTDDDVGKYVLEKLETHPSYNSWQRAAKMLVDKAPVESIIQQVELALLLDGQLDVDFTASEALRQSEN